MESNHEFYLLVLPTFSSCSLWSLVYSANPVKPKWYSSQHV